MTLPLLLHLAHMPLTNVSLSHIVIIIIINIIINYCCYCYQQVPHHTVTPDILTCVNQECSSIRQFYPLLLSFFPQPSPLFFLLLFSTRGFPSPLFTSPAPQYLCPSCLFFTCVFVEAFSHLLLFLLTPCILFFLPFSPLVKRFFPIQVTHSVMTMLYHL